MDKSHNWRETFTTVNTTILSALDQINNNAWRILLVVDEHERLLGVITDGDIRRHLLRKQSLDAPVDLVMNKTPVTGQLQDSQEQLLLKMHAKGVLHIPILDNSGKVIRLETFDSLYAKDSKDNYVVLMAGGLGTRLAPLTSDCPKPLLKIGDKPIAEILLEQFIRSGFHNFYFSVNYKADMIKRYFGDGARWMVNIEYIEENNALGTAGSLSLLPIKPTKPLFVVNSDILTNINFRYILDYHNEQLNNPLATLCVRLHHTTIPFGVVNIDENDYRLVDIVEKPQKSYFVNTGIYVLDPASLDYISFNNYCDMPSFLMNLIQHKETVCTYPIREYWLDIGHHDNLIKAATDYLEIFA